MPRSPTIQWLKDILAAKEEERAGSEAARPPAPTGPPPGPPPDGSEAVAPMGEGGSSSAGPGEGDAAHGPPRTDARVYPPVPPFEASVVLSLCDFKMLLDQPLPGWERQPNGC